MRSNIARTTAAFSIRGGRVSILYSGLHLYEEAVLGFPLPLRERDRVRGKAVATHLLIQTKSAVVRIMASKPVADWLEDLRGSLSTQQDIQMPPLAKDLILHILSGRCPGRVLSPFFPLWPDVAVGKGQN